MQQVAKIIAAVAMISLGGCAALRREEPTTAVVTITKPTLIVPPVDMVTLRDVDWRIINKDSKPGQPGSVDEAFRKSHGTSLYALDAQDYQDLSVNTANLLRAIKQYQSQVRAYQDYYDTVEKSTQGTNDGDKKTTASK